MKILQVVTLMAPDGAFGGPLRVAVNQTRELLQRGHDVHLAAGWNGAGTPPPTVDNIPVRLYPLRQTVPGSGFKGLVSRALTRDLIRFARTADVVHVHAGRDLVSIAAMRAAVVTVTPFVTQTHGMIIPDSRFSVRLFDALLANRYLTQARAHLALNNLEAAQLAKLLAGAARVVTVPNGVPLLERRSDETASDRVPEILFCARLHPRKRPEIFVEIADELVRRGRRAKFTLIGPDEGSAALVQQEIARRGIGQHVQYVGPLPYDAVIARMREATVYVLPSVDEPFPMTLLEALSVGLPSVCTTSCGIADTLRTHNAAQVVDPTPQAMVDAVDRLLSDREFRLQQSLAAWSAARNVFALGAVAQALEEVYQDACHAS